MAFLPGRKTSTASTLSSKETISNTNANTPSPRSDTRRHPASTADIDLDLALLDDNSTQNDNFNRKWLVNDGGEQPGGDDNNDYDSQREEEYNENPTMGVVSIDSLRQISGALRAVADLIADGVYVDAQDGLRLVLGALDEVIEDSLPVPMLESSIETGEDGIPYTCGVSAKAGGWLVGAADALVLTVSHGDEEWDVQRDIHSITKLREAIVICTKEAGVEACVVPVYDDSYGEGSVTSALGLMSEDDLVERSMHVAEFLAECLVQKEILECEPLRKYLCIDTRGKAE